MMEFYLSDSKGRPLQGAADKPAGNYPGVTHDCPFCGQRASTGRTLAWIASECISKGKVLFPCNNCSEYITIPSDIFVEGCLEKLRKSSNMNYAITRMSQHELFVSNCGELVLAANNAGPVDLESLEWDGRGSCPGCGKEYAEELSQRLKCLKCQAEFWVKQKSISHTANTMVLCFKCRHVMIIPLTVWCPVCGRNLRSSDTFLKLFREANGV
ncbi:MAG: hypothetical protein K8S62_15695 [Candidatus Sabulitectum sp.]|nr:hypothetical protein [Candidatus Sabulitectum sp.]